MAMDGSGRPAPDGEQMGVVPLTAAEARRLRALTRFPVGGSTVLRAVDPARPAVGGAVLVLDLRRHARGAAVLTDTGAKAAEHLFALYVPSVGVPPLRAGQPVTDLWDHTWHLVDGDLVWNDVVDILSGSTITDAGTFERYFLVVGPATAQRISMRRFEMPPAPPVSAPVTAPPPPVANGTPPPTDTEIQDVGTAIEVLASVREAYAAYECDAQRVLAAPALADVREDATAAFVEAFVLAVALEPERPQSCPPAHAAHFITAVAAAEAAWEVAEAHAIRLGVAGYAPAQRTRIRRARQALDLALRPDTPAGEREASLAAARRLLDGLIVLPAPLEREITRAIGGVDRPALG